MYHELQDRGVEVLYDDREVSAGVMFSDADLLGVPFRAVVSPRNIKQHVVEVVSRDKTFSVDLPMGSASDEVRKILISQQGSRG